MSSINLINGGLDIGSIVDQLIYVEGEPIRRMQKQTTQTQSKITAFQAVNTRFSSLLDKINNVLFNGEAVPLRTPYSFEERFSSSVFAAISARSSNDDFISASGSKGSASGSFAVTVSSLAKAQTSASGNFADTTSAFQTGTLTIQVGSGDSVDVTIDASNNTLDGIRRAINTADAGVTASIINDGTPGSPFRLLVSADDTGTANSFTVTSNLSGAGQSISFAVTSAADDARLNINGIDIVKSSNAVSDVIDGVTLNLKAETASAVTITASPDTDAIISALKEFASAYNDANSYISSQYRYNSGTKTAGVLSGDATLRSAQARLQTLVTQSVSNPYTTLSVLSQAGVTFNSDGSISINETDFREAIADKLTAVAALFLGHGTAPDDTNPGDEGSSPIVNLRSALKAITDPLSGPIHSATDGLSSTIRQLNDQIEAYQDRLDVRRELLVREFSKADQALRLLGVTQSSLGAQVGSLGIFG